MEVARVCCRVCFVSVEPPRQRCVLPNHRRRPDVVQRISLVIVFGRRLHPQARKAQRAEHFEVPEPGGVDSVVASLETKAGGNIEELCNFARLTVRERHLAVFGGVRALLRHHLVRRTLCYL